MAKLAKLAGYASAAIRGCDIEICGMDLLDVLCIFSIAMLLLFVLGLL